MQTRPVLRTIATLLALAGFAVTACAQSQSQSQARVLPLFPINPQVVPNATATYTGAFIFNVVITIKPTIPANYPISCSAQVSPVEAGNFSTFDSKTVTAVRNGSTATCNFSINYSWNLASGSDMVNTTYSVSAIGDSTSLQSRVSSGTLASVSLPANATSLSRTVNVTL